jgi:6-phosphogluconolactonase
MSDRRQFCAGLAGMAVLPKITWARVAAMKTVFYASAGAQLSLYQVDDRNLSLARDSTVTLPAAMQYGWSHPSGQFLYAAYSNRAGSNIGDTNGVSAFRIDSKTGRLRPAGRGLELSSRPINITVDAKGAYLLVAYNDPSGVTVHPIDLDGSPGAAIRQGASIDAGVYAHQVRVAPSNRSVILVTRGNDATSAKPEDPGAIKVFEFRGGQLSDEQSIAPGNGFGFGPRHVDFHPSKPWMYVSMERENQLQVFGLQDGRLTLQSLFAKTTLLDPANVHTSQVVGPIHFSHDGKFVYLANRADRTVDFQGKKVFAGGENNMAVFRVDQTTGNPTLIQNIDTQAFHARTFSIHPDGGMLVAASIAPMFVRDGEQVKQIPAALSVFRVKSDGRLTFVHKYEMEIGLGLSFWCRMFAIPGD